MKKFLPALLIVIISLNAFGFNLILEYLIYSCKLHFNEYVKQEMNEDEIIVFKLSELNKDELIKYEDEGEFKYKGKMYDIFKEKKIDDDVLLLCWSDENEDHLNRIIDEKNDEKNNPTKLNYILKNLTKNFINPGLKIPELPFRNSHYINLHKSSYKSRYTEVISPPPNYLI